ncbi:alpha/beta hydrolase [Chondrinema litorale]|uniref:alpha/beta hydrolase n=1 Tax=Chondrinema litorale TaxID=2994555 RepID=UPI002543C9EB|nr:alpha/beta hydrolase [Chondrinema litorale]UZS00225.1 alpha/beta hydrolase [Chondrinema litorale]
MSKEVIHVGTKGTFEKYGIYYTTPQDIDDIIEHLKTSNKRQISLYFHGGLVNESDGFASANMMKEILNVANHHPISFVWKSGFIETIRERITTIHKTKIFKKILKLLLKKVGSKLGLSIDAKGFEQLSDSFVEAELKKDEPFADFLLEEDQNTKSPNLEKNSNQEIIISNETELLKELEKEYEIEIAQDIQIDELIEDIDPQETLINSSLLELKDGQDSKGFITTIQVVRFLSKIAFKVIKRYVQKRNHGFYPTVIEEIYREAYISDLGAWLWKGMKDKAAEMWLPNEGLEGDKQYVGTYFLTKLNEIGVPIDIDIVAHSAGSILTCHLLKNLSENYQNLKVSNVVFLAPACTSELFHQEVILHPERLKYFRMFTMTDEAESKDALVDNIKAIYPRSLLYFISGILEDGGENYDAYILGMERFFKFENYEKVEILKDIKDYLLAEGKERLVLSPTQNNLDGFNCMAIDHGKFDDDITTKESIQHILTINT